MDTIELSCYTHATLFFENFETIIVPITCITSFSADLSNKRTAGDFLCDALDISFSKEANVLSTLDRNYNSKSAFERIFTQCDLVSISLTHSEIPENILHIHCSWDINDPYNYSCNNWQISDFDEAGSLILRIDSNLDLTLAAERMQHHNQSIHFSQFEMDHFLSALSNLESIAKEEKFIDPTRLIAITEQFSSFYERKSFATTFLD